MEVRIGEWLSEGWSLIKDDLMTFALAALVVGLLGAFSLGVCAPALMFGLYMMVFRRMRGEKVASGDVMQGFSRFGNGLYLFGLVLAFACVLGAAFAGPLGLLAALRGHQPQQPNLGLQYGMQGIQQVIGILLQTVLFFMYARIADLNCDPITAIRDSFAVVQRNFVGFLACAFLFYVIQLVGFLACCVGAFVAMPLVVAATACAYRDVFGVSSFGIPPRGVSYQAPKAGMVMPPTAGSPLPSTAGPSLPPTAGPSLPPGPPVPPTAGPSVPPPPVAPPPVAPPLEPPSEGGATPGSSE